MGVLNELFPNVKQNREMDTSNSLFNFMLKKPAATATADTSLTISAFYNGVDVISNDIAKLPKGVFLKTDKSRNSADDIPVSYLLSSSPNKLMTSFDWWKIMTISCILKGDGFSSIVRNGQSGFEEAIIFHNYDDVKVTVSGLDIIYNVKGYGIIPAENMIHFKAFSFDGIRGNSVIKFAAKQLGVSLDTQEYASEVYRHQGVGHGVIESDKSVDVKNKKAIEDGFVSKMNSSERFKVPMLDEGMKYKSISITPAESLFLETNKLAVIECCRWLNLAPVKIKDMSAGTYLNIYQQGIEHVQDSILPWVTRMEQEINKKCFTRESGLYFKMNINALLRGDLDSKRNYYTSMVNFGIYTPNEIRALEELNPIEGLDQIFVPVNMQTLENASQTRTDGTTDNNNG